MYKSLTLFILSLSIPTCAPDGSPEDVIELATALESAGGDRFDVAEASVDGCTIRVELFDSNYCSTNPKAGSERIIRVMDLSKFDKKTMRITRPKREALPEYAVNLRFNSEADSVIRKFKDEYRHFLDAQRAQRKVDDAPIDIEPFLAINPLDALPAYQSSQRCDGGKGLLLSTGSFSFYLDAESERAVHELFSKALNYCSGDK